MHCTVSVRNAIIISRPNSERGDANRWEEMARKQWGRTRGMTVDGEKSWGPS